MHEQGPVKLVQAIQGFVERMQVSVDIMSKEFKLVWKQEI